ncbi:MAG: hypothetical protein B7Z80_14215 [Rhodospirillales bacterium 20-64-7]|nr:MAG: hypothetical protein B7Z80_14215 [Rhodospirillales bacterium 20-64-7]
MWKPSNARLVTLDSFVPVPRGSVAVAPPPLSWPAKDPGDILDYIIDISPAVLGNDSDAVATLDVSVSPSNPGDVVVQSTTTDGTRIVLWLTQGQAGTVYTVTLSIATISGRFLERSVLLPVLMLSSPTVPPNAIITATGVVITDQNGNPVLSS